MTHRFVNVVDGIAKYAYMSKEELLQPGTLGIDFLSNDILTDNYRILVRNNRLNAVYSGRRHRWKSDWRICSVIISRLSWATDHRDYSYTISIIKYVNGMPTDMPFDDLVIARMVNLYAMSFQQRI